MDLLPTPRPPPPAPCTESSPSGASAVNLGRPHGFAHTLLRGLVGAQRAAQAPGPPGCFSAATWDNGFARARAPSIRCIPHRLDESVPCNQGPGLAPLALGLLSTPAPAGPGATGQFLLGKGGRLCARKGPGVTQKQPPRRAWASCMGPVRGGEGSTPLVERHVCALPAARRMLYFTVYGPANASCELAGGRRGRERGRCGGKQLESLSRGLRSPAGRPLISPPLPAWPRPTLGAGCCGQNKPWACCPSPSLQRDGEGRGAGFLPSLGQLGLGGKTLHSPPPP